MKVGLLTSGGDCQGLNAVLRGVAKTLYGSIKNLELYGIADGYRGLIDGEWRKMGPEEFSGILRLGGTILGTSRQPYKEMQTLNENNTSKLNMMMKMMLGKKLEEGVNALAEGIAKAFNAI